MADGSTQTNGRGNGGYFRRGDLPLLVMLALQLVAGGYFIGTISQRVAALEGENTMLRLQVQQNCGVK